MDLMKPARLFLLGGLALIYLLTWIIQANTLVYSDISLGLHQSSLLFAGGSYGKDFFETNPPLYLYLYMLPVILAKFLPFKLFKIFHLYIFLLISLSLCLAYPCLKLIFPQRDLIERHCSLLMLAFVLLLLPMSWVFGEREHLLLTLTLPYLLLLVCRLDKQKINPYLALTIGLIAGLGFALKPFFCLSFALLELYLIFRQRDWRAWLRVENLTIIVVIISYLFSILIFHSNYLRIILPLSWRFYYPGVHQEWGRILTHPAFLFCSVPLLLAPILLQNKPYQNLSAILLIAMLGFSGSYLMQGTLWYYHIYPAYALALLLTVLFFTLLATQKVMTRLRYISITLIASLTFLIPVFYALATFNSLLSYQKKSEGLINFLRDHARHQPVYFLSRTLRIEYPLVDYAEAIPASQYPCLQWFAGYLNQKQAKISPALRLQLEKDREYFLNSMASELVANKPLLIFVESGEMAPLIDGHPYSLLKDFSQNVNFRAAWKNYRYLTELNENAFYHFQVYQRILS